LSRTWCELQNTETEEHKVQGENPSLVVRRWRPGSKALVLSFDEKLRRNIKHVGEFCVCFLFTRPSWAVFLTYIYHIATNTAMSSNAYPNPDQIYPRSSLKRL